MSDDNKHQRPKLQFQVRRSGPVPIPPGQLGSDYTLLEQRLMHSYKIVADLEFTRLLHRIKAGPMWINRGTSKFVRLFYTVDYIENLGKE